MFKKRNGTKTCGDASSQNGTKTCGDASAQNDTKTRGTKTRGGDITKRQFFAVLLYLTLSCVVFLLAFRLTFRSYGWFSSNKEVSGSGLSVSVESTPNLIISDDEDDVTDCTAEDSYDLFRKVFTGTSEELEPAMHDAVTHGLLVIADKDNINPLTGMAKVSDTFTYTTAVADVNYVDFVTYVGVSGTSADYTNLAVAFNSEKCYAACVKGETVKSGVTYYTYADSVFTKATPTVGSSAVGYYTHKFTGVYRTVSVDVFYDDAYCGTIHPFAIGKSGGTQTLSASGTLTPSDPSKVTLRVYFDGSMTDPDDATGKTILRAGNQHVNQIFLGFSFTVDSFAH